MNRAADQLQLSKIFFLALVLSACATQQKQAESQDGKIEPSKFTSDLYVDHEGKSYRLKSDIFILDPSSVRIDILTSLDLPLASVVLTKDEVRYALYREKKFYEGKPNPNALDPVFPLSVDSADLVAVLMEKQIASQTCERDNQGRLLKCHAEEPLNYEVEWGKRTQTGPMAGKATRVSLKVPKRKVELKFYLRSMAKNLDNSHALLQINIPSDFKTLPVPKSPQQ